MLNEYGDLSNFSILPDEILKYGSQKLDSGSLASSPVNGEVTRVDCQVGDTVKAGQKLAVVIAMKMENVIVQGETQKSRRLWSKSERKWGKIKSWLNSKMKSEPII